MKRRTLALLILAATHSHAMAQDPAAPPAPPHPEAPSTPPSRGPAPPPRGPTWAEKSAAQVLRSLAERDETILAFVAGRDGPDPWLVADALCALGEHDAAARLAAARPRPDTARLPEYVASRRTAGAAPSLRSQITHAVDTIVAGRPEEGLALLDAIPIDPVAEPACAARITNARAMAHRAAGRRADAIAGFRRAAEMYAAMGWLAREADMLDDAGNLFLADGAARDAIEIYARLDVLALRRNARVHEIRAASDDHGRPRVPAEVAAALDVATKRLDGARAAGDEPAIARALLALASACRDAEQPARSLSLCEEALAVAERKGDNDLRRDCLAALAASSHALPDDRRSGILEQLVRIARASGDPKAISRALTTLGSFHASGRRLPAARAVLGEALVLAEKAGDPAATAEGRRVLGRVCTYERKFAEAIELQMQSLRAGYDARDDALTARSLQALAVTSQRSGDFREAFRFGDEKRRLEPRDADWDGYMASIEAEAGHAEGALVSAARAAAGIHGRFAGYDPAETAIARGSVSQAYSPGLGAAVLRRDTRAMCWFLEEGSGGALLEEMHVRESAARGASPPEFRTADEAARVRFGEAAAALRSAVAGGDIAAIQMATERFTAARREAELAAQRAIRHERSQTDRDRPAVNSLDTIRARIGADEALVIYGLVPNSMLDSASALVVTRDLVRIVRLGKHREITAAAKAAAAAAADRGSGAAPIDALRVLIGDALLLGPAVRRVIVVPHRDLNRVAPSLLFPGRDVCFVPSGTVHGRLLRSAGARGNGVLAVGDPDYDAGDVPADTAPQGAADASVARGRMTLRRLPATGDEARAVGDVVLTRGAATESGFWAALAQRPRWRAVHIAAHGLADTGHELRSGIALTPSPQDDGLLSVLDVYRAGVNADLVVLSGCDTGMGRHLATDGYFGLSQAFLLAGAPRVLVSLWPVDDRATAALMTHFHASFRKGTPAARALREAQDAVRATPGWEHPSYWAAWVLWGLAE